MTTIGDPRIWPSATTAEPCAALYRRVAQSLGAATSAEAEGHDAAVESQLRSLLANRDSGTLVQVFDSAPSSAIYRHLWRALVRAESAHRGVGTLAVTVFALPLVIVAGRENGDEPLATLPCIVHNVSEIADVLREHGALAGNESFALANTLVAAEAIDIGHLASIDAWRDLGDDSIARMRELPGLSPAPIAIEARDPRVHLRFIVGAAMAAQGADLVADSSVGRWGMPLTQLLGRAFAQENVTLLILPLAPKRPCVALQLGRAAQREVSAQLFASNAIRKMRASVGEPAAAISAHRAADTVTGGELRVSLSSPFDPGQAEGFRCPLYRTDQPSVVADMLATLLRDCRVADVRVLPGVHADRDPATGSHLLFKAEALDDAPPITTIQ